MTPTPQKIHLIGIGGIGMSALARHLIARGDIVSGSDLVQSQMTDDLEKLGAKITIGEQKPENLPPSAQEVVVTLAIAEDNPELIEAKKRGLAVKTYQNKAGELFNDKRGIAICGTNGKTTTTGMVSEILVKADLDPSLIIGSMLGGTNARVGRSDLFILEACEYKRGFLNYQPEICIVTNIEPDHLDYYKDLDDIIDAFGHFFSQTKSGGLLIANADDPEVARVTKDFPEKKITYAIKNNADYQAFDIDLQKDKTLFKIKSQADPEVNDLQFELPVSGQHNVLNALAAIACARYLKVPPETIRSALVAYQGTWRRFEVKGEFSGVTIVEDYAHHPTSIKVTLAAARQKYPGRRLLAAFQPHHQYRLEALFDEFAQSFPDADKAFLVDVYQVAGRTGAKTDLNSEKLAHACAKQSQTDCIYSGNLDQTPKAILAEVRPDDVLLIMGAGDITKTTKEIITALKKKSGSK